MGAWRFNRGPKNNPHLNFNANYDALEQEYTNRLRSICYVAKREGHDSLVLGAFGCGVFNNDPEKVAKLFRKVLSEFKFKKVYFAYLKLSERDEHGFRIFKKILAPRQHNFE